MTDETNRTEQADDTAGSDSKRLVSGSTEPKVEINFITAKGAAYLWLAKHVKPAWLRSAILSLTLHIPVWFFAALGFRGYKPDWSR